MTQIIRPGAGILFMKVGTHAQETLADIIERKSREISDAGYGMWGYGGNTCHPRTMVQPFAEAKAAEGQPIILCMEAMESKHFAEPVRATSFSPDGLTWKPIPEAINVLGSRFALVIGDLRREEHILPLTQTRVAVGNNQGRLGSRYIQGHVDKACFDILEEPERVNEEDQRVRQISLVATMIAPYAVFLRND
jgi:hypothetical protein